MKIAVLLLAGCVGAVAPDAVAQEAAPASRLFCQGNEALVRIGDLPVPDALTAKWKYAAPATSDRCKLANGQDVLVRYRERQGFAWGMMGGSPPYEISLWVNGRKLVSRDRFRPENIGGMYGTLNRIAYAPGKLELCRYPDGVAVDMANPTCTTRNVNLSAMSRDPLELGNEERVGRISIAAVNEPFCQSFVRRTGDNDGLHPHGNVFSLGLDRSKSIESVAFGLQGQDMPFDERAKVLVEDRGGISVSLARFDFFNGGRVQPVLQITGEAREFFGTAYLVGAADRTDADAEAVVKTMRSKWMLPDELAKLVAKDGWYLAQEPFDPHMRQVVARISGVTFVFAEPFYVLDNATASIYRPIGRGMERLCVFQETEPNF